MMLLIELTRSISRACQDCQVSRQFDTIINCSNGVPSVDRLLGRSDLHLGSLDMKYLMVTLILFNEFSYNININP